ncbi:MAG: miaA [Gammaproteobacteria bacterium]|jgi:tRNA dimethylallyltransferase|nr:miaA [Gammaproteobacteria bacterium]
MQKKLITLMGPTATGKTDLAIQLAQVLPLEIISVDSALVYCGMDIGTAKPSPEVLQKLPHHLIDIISPETNYSVAAFLNDAKQAIQEIQSRGKVPLLVGGTMLYFKALTEGLADIPPVPEAIRTHLKEELTQQGLAVFYQRLAAVDPVSAARIHANDAQRILRALEVYESSGKTLSAWIEAGQRQHDLGEILQISLIPEDRAYLHQVLAERFQQMLDMGFVAEVERLKHKYHLQADLSSMRCVGYRQVWQYLANEITYPEMVEQGIAASRQLAKRQMTWLRAWPAHHMIAAYQKQALQSIQELIKKNF